MNKLRILLAQSNREDEFFTTFGLMRAKVPADVQIARDGIQALEYLHNQSRQLPDCVLLDLNLPKLDGLDVLRRIRAERQTRGIPVVLLADSDEERDKTQCFSVGPTSYLVKKAGLDNFVEALKGIFQESVKDTIKKSLLRINNEAPHSI